jgi:putative ABC transport system substrate-binding protein
MHRRDAVLVLAALSAIPLGTLAQQSGRVWRVGVLWPGESSPPSPRLEAFRQGMRELGYIEGRNVLFVYRYA